MSTFTEPLTVTKKKNGKWKVARKFRYYIGIEKSNDYIDVPRGFETDFASVPRSLWSIFPPDGKYSQACCLHDYLYTKHLLSRKTSDRIFLEAMTVLKVSWLKRTLMFRAVRIFGRGPWKRGYKPD